MSSQSFANLANSEFNGNIILKNGYIQFPDGSQQTTAGGGGGGNVSTTTINTYTNTSVNDFEAAEITCSTQLNSDNSTLVANTEFVQTRVGTVGQLNNDNTAIGISVLELLTTGSANTGYGSNCLYYVTSGADNTCIGFNAGLNISTASNNTAVGFSALQETNGSNNTACGYQAGDHDINGSNNTYLGAGAQQQDLDTSSYNYLTLIGADSEPVNVGLDNQIVLGRLNGDDELFITGNNIFLGNQNNINETYTIEASGSNSTLIFTAQSSVPTGYENILTLSTTSNSVPTLSYVDNGTSIVNQTMLSTAFNNIIKTGSVTINGNQPSVVTFSTPFPVGVVPIVTVQNNQGALLNTIILITGNVSNIQFDVWESGAGSPIVMSINYIAIGLP
jgi:hypothetical protein